MNLPQKLLGYICLILRVVREDRGEGLNRDQLLDNFTTHFSLLSPICIRFNLNGPSHPCPFYGYRQISQSNLS